MSEPDAFEQERERMVADQLVYRGIQNPRVLQAMRKVPRHLFVSAEYADVAYSDGPLPIGKGQTISQPYIVALMTQFLQLEGSEKVLEVGTGSGYQAAVLAHLAKEVYTIERHAELASQAIQVLQDLKLENVHVHVGDGSLGLPEFAPFQGILVTAAAPEVPVTLLEQLDDGGRMVLPVGGRMDQYLELWLRRGERYEKEALVPVAFVPLRGHHGWEGEW